MVVQNRRRRNVGKSTLVNVLRKPIIIDLDFMHLMRRIETRILGSWLEWKKISRYRGAETQRPILVSKGAGSSSKGVKSVQPRPLLFLLPMWSEPIYHESLLLSLLLLLSLREVF